MVVVDVVDDVADDDAADDDVVALGVLPAGAMIDWSSRVRTVLFCASPGADISTSE